jgi:hypothetical protein
VTDATGHLPYWTLELLAEDDLPHAERTLAERHLRACGACRAELESARSLVEALAALPTYDPPPSFADAVMARVAIAPAVAPAAAPQAAPVRWWSPSTRRGWTLLGALAMLPALPLLALAGWLFSRPGVSPGALWTVGRGWMQDVAWSLVVDATGALLRSGAVEWTAGLLALAPDAAFGGLPVALLLAAIAIPASAWMMVRLLKTPMGGMTHAH